MEIYNKIVAKYFQENDTPVKNVIMDDFKNNNFSINSHIDDVLFKCGLITVNCVPTIDVKNKWMPYLNFSPENIFQEKKGVKDLVKYPVNSNNAQKILAEEIIKLFHFINMEKLKNALK